MKEMNERSVASAGSVGEPLAFAVMQPDSYVVVHSLHSAFAMRDMCGGGEIVPLYRKPPPTLTAEEREAVWDGIYLCEDAAGTCNEAVHARAWAKSAGLLRGLLERPGGAM